VRRKVGTVLDESLYRRARLEAARRARPISEILAEALEDYLKRRGRHDEPGVVADTWAVLSLDRTRVKQILEEPERPS
jgi:hypothetical protein